MHGQQIIKSEPLTLHRPPPPSSTDSCMPIPIRIESCGACLYVVVNRKMGNPLVTRQTSWCNRTGKHMKTTKINALFTKLPMRTRSWLLTETHSFSILLLKFLVNQPVRSVAVRPTGLPITGTDSSLFRNYPRG
jgi:hypothetical protein